MSVSEEDEWEEVPPDPGATIESLRALGYTPGSAVADLIDNSVTASAAHVWVTGKWAGTDSWIAIVDDGVGMTDQRLRQAMRIGSGDPLDVRAEGDLGRFGFGLKTASFSQAREVSVVTRKSQGRRWLSRTWDLDHVRKSGRWLLRTAAPSDAQRIIDRLHLPEQGTAVLWRRLTSVETEGESSAAQREFIRRLDEISRHLGMVFGRLVSAKRLDIQIGRHHVKPWDPFVNWHEATQELPPEKLTLAGLDVVVRPFVLPHHSKLSSLQVQEAGGPAGWNEQQGFYVYRKDRLITAGDWLGLGLARGDMHNLSRISIDVPPGLDEEWKLDIRKAVVRPPDPLRPDLMRIAKFTRGKAAAANRLRGTHVTRKGRSPVEQLWIQRARRGHMRLTINRRHPLVAHALETAGAHRRDLSDLMALLEETIPALLLAAPPPNDTPLEDRPPEEIVRIAEVAYDSLLTEGLSRKEACQRLKNTEPFHLYPALIDEFGEAP